MSSQPTAWSGSDAEDVDDDRVHVIEELGRIAGLVAKLGEKEAGGHVGGPAASPAVQSPESPFPRSV
jgi:hypothetical protein